MRDNAPIKNTCPDIDRVVSAVKSIQKLCKLDGSETSQDYVNIISDIENEIFGQDGSLEELRDANSQLRDWGNAEHERANESEEEVYSLRKEISDLKDENEDLEKQLSKMEDELESIERSNQIN
jgi:chromosome segregation ATPase